MKKNLGTNFLLCGLCGWCMECLWTGMNSLIHYKTEGNELLCKTSLWMFPIYGAAALISPIFKKIKNQSTTLRGLIYTAGIYATELLTGIFLQKFKACPWDYSKSKFNFKGVIRLDYLPAWFAAGLFFERILKMKET